MTENKRYSFNWERGHPNFWDNHCDLPDCYLTCRDVVNILNELNDENEQLKQGLNDNLELIGQLQKENKQLKQRIKELEQEIEDLRMDNIRLNKCCDSFMKELGLNDDWGITVWF